MVPLGSECPDFALHCEGRPPAGMDAGRDAGRDAGTLEPEAGPGEDAGGTATPDAALPDASTPVVDAGEPAFPGIRNGTFAITSEPPEPGDVSLLGDAEIAPWRWCAGSVRVGPDLGDYPPSDGDSLISLAFGAGPALLGQGLTEPLEPGRPYALALDVARSENGNDELRLELLGTELTCTSAETLAITPPLVAGSALTTYCLRFVPLEPHTHLTLRVSPLASVGTVFVDNLRPADDCP